MDGGVGLRKVPQIGERVLEKTVAEKFVKCPFEWHGQGLLYLGEERKEESRLKVAQPN